MGKIKQIRPLRIALIADTFPPMRTSGAVQLRDLSREFINLGHRITVILPSSEIVENWKIEKSEDLTILRLKTPKTKGLNYFWRTINEFWMPFMMKQNYKKSPLVKQSIDYLVWYSPSIFHGPFVSFLKKLKACRSYLIIRDIFPEWALDMGLINKGLPYLFFKLIAQFQYKVADIIGVQSPGNIRYFEFWQSKFGKKVEVLQNWSGEPGKRESSIQVGETKLAGRKICIYAGNMGVAQGMKIIIDLAKKMDKDPNLGFIFVGRGSEVDQLKKLSVEYRLTNVLFYDEIDPDEIPNLYKQCHIGLVSLDRRHKSHNVPGKFLTYMQSGIPVLANINPGNDLLSIIKDEHVGRANSTNDLNELKQSLEDLLNDIETDSDIRKRCKQLFRNEYSSVKAVNQIISTII